MFNNAHAETLSALLRELTSSDLWRRVGPFAQGFEWRGWILGSLDGTVEGRGQQLRTAGSGREQLGVFCNVLELMT